MTALGISFFMLLATFSMTHAGNDASWRCSENGGINALYCYLRTNGVSCAYSDLLCAQSKSREPDYSAATLARIGTENGIPLRMVSLNMRELASCPMPLLVHVDGETPEMGAFILMLTITDKSIYYVNGPTATIRSIDIENFRRVWSGIALLPISGWQTNYMAFLIGSGMAILLISILRIYFSRRRS